MQRIGIAVILAFLLLPASALSQETRIVTDAQDRRMEIPVEVTRVICSGSGSLRLLTYLKAQHMIVAVEDIETRRDQFDTRPYALANPQFKDMKVFGQYRGQDHPERILALDPAPQVIFKTYSAMGHDPVELQQKTGIPVIILTYGELAGPGRKDLYQALRIMGEVVGRSDRAEEVIAFFESQIRELKERTDDVPAAERPAVYIGGVAYRGPHGYQSTEPAYPPFHFVQARNVAGEGPLGRELQHSDVAKEKILEWDPEYLFLDLSTLQLGESAGGLWELRNDPAYRALTAVQEGKVYGTLPYNWYSRNFGSILADAWFVGKLLYPDRFGDVEPKAKADEIYRFLVDKPVFSIMNEDFQNLAFSKVPVN